MRRHSPHSDVTVMRFSENDSTLGRPRSENANIGKNEYVVYVNSYIPGMNRPIIFIMYTFTLIGNIFTHHYDIKGHNLHGIF